jgi:hypothetical protein
VELDARCEGMALRRRHVGLEAERGLLDGHPLYRAATIEPFGQPEDQAIRMDVSHRLAHRPLLMTAPLAAGGDEQHRQQRSTTPEAFRAHHPTPLPTLANGYLMPLRRST